MTQLTRHGILSTSIAAFLLYQPASADPVTGWLGDPLIPNGATVVITDANTASPTIGDGTLDSADRSGIWAAFPTVTLANGDIITLTGSATIIGTDPAGNQFRWGLFGDNGSPDTTEWLGFLAAQSNGGGGGNLWSKDPAGTNFADSSFLSTNSGRGFSLGTAADPDGDTWADATYDFSLSVGRLSDTLIVNASLTSNDAGFTNGWSQEWTDLSETEPSRITFDYNRVGFLSGNSTNIDQIQMQDIDVSLSQVQSLTLEVNTDTGSTRIVNNSDQSFPINAYEVLSANGSLNPTGWNSLDDQNIDAVDGPDPGDFAGDSINEGWDEAAGSSANVLSEVFLSGNSPLGMEDSLNLGSAFDIGDMQDLQFNFTVLGATGITGGFVQYVTGVDNADFDGDGDVDGADFLTWQRGFGAAGGLADGDANGDGTINGADRAIWESQFVTGGSSGLATATVPEPTTLWLACIAVLIAVRFAGRRVNR